MSFTLTTTAQDKQTAAKQEPELILEIEGYENTFSMNNILKYTRVGDDGLYVDGTWLIGGSTLKPNNLAYISVDGTTSTISQQLQQDKGGTSSVTSFQISLVDFHGEVTELISPGKVLDDVLGREAYVYLGYKDTIFPYDYVLLFNGIIDEVESGSKIKLNVSNPEQKKRQDIFPVVETELNGSITNVQTTIPLSSAANFLLPVTDIFSTYVKIDDEIIRYTGISTNTLTGCTRAQFGTIAASHDDEASASQWMRLQGNAIDLALQLMLSGPDVYYKSNIAVANFGQDGDSNLVTNGIYFTDLDVETKWGLDVGDFITTTGALNGGNNFSLRSVTSITTDIAGSLVIVDGAALTLEVNSDAVAAFSSQYNVLPDGLGLGGHQVDVPEFLRIQNLFSSSIPIYDFYVTDTIHAKDFIDKEVLFPANLFSLPKKGKISVGVVSPPLAVSTLPSLNSSNVTKPESIKIKRSIGKYFYNTVIYKFNYDAVQTDKPLTGYILVDEDSKAQIPIGTKSITIEGRGLRNDNDTLPILNINARRLLKKYKFAAEAITINVFYGVGFNIDVGDVVLFGGDDLNLPDSTNGVRGFTPRLCEVIDKKMNIFQGTVSLTIIDTSYLSSGRYGIISPSSNITTGSTDSILNIVDSYGVTSPDIEKNKWLPYIGENIFIHNDDYSITYNSKLLGFDISDDYKMLIEPVATPPVSGMVVDVAKYDDGSDPVVNRVLKNVFVYTNPSIAVTSGVDDFEFVIGAGDVSKVLVGATIMLHNVDWSVTSGEVKVLEINTNNIVVDKTLGFTPTSAYTVELVGFKDAGAAYRFL